MTQPPETLNWDRNNKQYKKKTIERLQQVEKDKSQTGKSTMGSVLVGTLHAVVSTLPPSSLRWLGQLDTMLRKRTVPWNYPSRWFRYVDDTWVNIQITAWRWARTPFSWRLTSPGGAVITIPSLPISPHSGIAGRILCLVRYSIGCWDTTWHCANFGRAMIVLRYAYLYLSSSSS